jgi:hypothetical protein
MLVPSAVTLSLSQVLLHGGFEQAVEQSLLQSTDRRQTPWRERHWYFGVWDGPLLLNMSQGFRRIIPGVRVGNIGRHQREIGFPYGSQVILILCINTDIPEPDQQISPLKLLSKGCFGAADCCNRDHRSAAVMVHFIKEQVGAGGDAYAAAVPNGRCDNIRGPLNLRLRGGPLELDQQALHPSVINAAEFTPA